MWNFTTVICSYTLRGTARTTCDSHPARLVAGTGTCRSRFLLNKWGVSETTAIVSLRSVLFVIYDVPSMMNVYAEVWPFCHLLHKSQKISVVLDFDPLFKVKLMLQSEPGCLVSVNMSLKHYEIRDTQTAGLCGCQSCRSRSERVKLSHAGFVTA